MSVVVFFFFYCYCHPRDLHSFPTRRSSDLRPRHCFEELSSHLLGRRLRGVAGHEGDPRRVDRKSTRLNSSHRCISYAVFCLKKKKKKKRKHISRRQQNRQSAQTRNIPEPVH